MWQEVPHDPLPRHGVRYVELPNSRLFDELAKALV
jgi:hypothetical protein